VPTFFVIDLMQYLTYVRYVFFSCKFYLLFIVSYRFRRELCRLLGMRLTVASKASNATQQAAAAAAAVAATAFDNKKKSIVDELKKKLLVSKENNKRQITHHRHSYPPQRQRRLDIAIAGYYGTEPNNNNSAPVIRAHSLNYNRLKCFSTQRL
jgi:hypothetical protein